MIWLLSLAGGTQTDAMAETIGIGQLRADTRAYLQRVACGYTLEVLRRGRLAALIEPVPQRSVRGAGAYELINVELSSFRSQAARYLDRVGSGCTVHVYDRGRAVAQIRSIDH